MGEIRDLRQKKSKTEGNKITETRKKTETDKKP